MLDCSGKSHQSILVGPMPKKRGAHLKNRLEYPSKLNIGKISCRQKRDKKGQFSKVLIHADMTKIEAQPNNETPS